VVKLSTRPVSRLTFTRDVDEISDSKVRFTVMPVCLLALALLNLLQVLPGEFHGIISAFGELLRFLTR